METMERSKRRSRRSYTREFKTEIVGHALPVTGRLPR
jgi:transposase-like protein